MMSRRGLKSLSELSAFLEAGGFGYAVQRIHAVEQGRGDWFEWLVRPNLGEEVSTDEFIEAVNALGLGLDLDMRTATDGIRWLAEQPDDTWLTINVTGDAIATSMFTRHLCQQFEHTGVDPSRICFDLAVHDALGDLSGATRFVKAMREMNCCIALDNGVPGNPVLGLFGPLGMVDYVKIDRRWVVAAPESEAHAETLKSIVDHAHRLGLRVIAEGVDSEAQLTIAHQLGINFYQGFIDGEPRVIARHDPRADAIQDVG